MTDLSCVLTNLAESAALMVRADAAAVCLLDNSDTRLSVAAVYGLSANLLSLPPRKVQAGTLDGEALAGHPVVVGDSERDPGADLLDPDFHAAICIAIGDASHPVGTLHVYSKVPNCFCASDAALLEPLADLAEASVASARTIARLEAREGSTAQFVRVATHELRSPVTVAQSLVRSVLKRYLGQLTEEQADVLARVSRRLDLLERLVNDLLDLAAGQATQPSEQAPVSLNASIGRVMLLLQPRAEEKQLILTLRPCRDPLVVRATEEGLDRLWLNLVSNAVKYTLPGGTVTVTVSRAGGEAQVQVADTGIGIPPEALPHVFQEFYRAPNAKQMAEVGTGLGLAIVNDLVTRFRGRVQVQSIIGQGTTFTVSLPLVS